MGPELLGHCTSALILDNIIQNCTGNGVSLVENSSARITNNMIQNNTGVGIFVTESSNARVGFMSEGEGPSPNTIQNNGDFGIIVARGAQSRIGANTISGNANGGVLVRGLSQADIASNAIDNNSGHGIQVSQGSGANLGNDTGTGFMDLPNSTTTLNAGFGISCTGGYVDGRQGTINGTAGATSFGANCNNSLMP